MTLYLALAGFIVAIGFILSDLIKATERDLDGY